MSLQRQSSKNRSRAITSDTAAAVFDPPISWLQMLSAGAITMKDEAGTTVTYPALLAGQVVPGPFSAYTSCTSSNVILGDGPPPSPAIVTVDAVASVSLDARVSTETSTRTSADTSLTTRVSSSVASLDTRVSTESSTRASADTSLTTRVSSSVASIDTRISSLIASIDA
jgi:hypothetical protein